MAHGETMTRRRLPHWYVPGAPCFVTYRLHGSLPQTALETLRARTELLLRSKRQPGVSNLAFREQVHKQLFAAYDEWLDRSNDDVLAKPRIAALIRSNLYHHHGLKYHLISYCVMPNHVHVLFQPINRNGTGGSAEARESRSQPPVIAAGEDFDIGERPDANSTLAKIMHSLKSYTAHEANKLLHRTGTFWQAESYDHWVRDDEELERIVNYIRANPVKAGLVDEHQDWFFCSCHDRFMTDGEPVGWLRWE